jgi:hypothetical protein
VIATLLAYPFMGFGAAIFGYFMVVYRRYIFKSVEEWKKELEETRDNIRREGKFIEDERRQGNPDVDTLFIDSAKNVKKPYRET